MWPWASRRSWRWGSSLRFCCSERQRSELAAALLPRIQHRLIEGFPGDLAYRGDALGDRRAGLHLAAKFLDGRKAHHTLAVDEGRGDTYHIELLCETLVGIEAGAAFFGVDLVGVDAQLLEFCIDLGEQLRAL